MLKIKLFLSIFVLFSLTLSNSTVNANEFKSNKLHIKFDNQKAKVLNWKILNKSMKTPHDLIQENISSFGLDGTIDGFQLDYWVNQAGGWNIDKTSDELSFYLKSENIPFELNKYWKFYEDSYIVDLSYELIPKKNLSNTELYLTLGPGIGEKPIGDLGIAESSYSFTELIYKTKEIKTKKLEDKKEVFLLNQNNSLKWVGLHSRYFLFLLKTNDNFSNIELNIDQINNDKNISLDSSLKINLPYTDLKKDEIYESSFQLFTGTKTKNDLMTAELDDILFQSLWGWMRYIVLGIMVLLYWINDFIFNWGISIIILSILVRIVIHPIAKKSLQSQHEFAKIQEIIQPKIKEIKEKYKGGEQSERILNIYEKYNISPLGSLKPLIGLAIQIPIFIALFHLLGQTFELKEASFLWIESLAEPDKFLMLGKSIPFFGNYFNLLPVLMSLTNLLSIKLSSANSTYNKSDIKQNIGLGLMTIAFFLLFYSFPSGMVLYWTMANLLHLGYSLITLKKNHNH